jgi:hypothetical protein
MVENILLGVLAALLHGISGQKPPGTKGVGNPMQRAFATPFVNSHFAATNQTIVMCQKI